MSSVSLPVTRPAGRALVIGSVRCRGGPVGTLQTLGYGCGEADDPYAAMSELSRRPLAYRAVILSLNSVYREELHLIATTKRRYPHVEIWLTDTDGRQAALVEAMRLGADGLLAEDGLHRIAVAGAPAAPAPAPPAAKSAIAVAAFAAVDPPSQLPVPLWVSPARLASPEVTAAAVGGEAVLTADELRALLQEQPAAPPPAAGA